ncbi:hypothetical protein HR45_08145 [Shewanella mangrovi]|uniref:Uncharacterized protein n=1 Tax=Shewanella mangrovi TaxID=1515746 RepID=A0A094JF35_9GAMM|nr:tetratricopeptide repeat protein [Shewanella mangrovi]KFZ37817.1 hypothetical protein HR45_08145 [Shewanella mangrovi]
MSVVNQMLKELDKRQQQHGFSTVAQSQLPPERAKSAWKLLVIGLLLGALMVIAGWWLLTTAATQPVIPVEVETANAPTPVKAANVANPSSAQTLVAETPASATTPIQPLVSVKGTPAAKTLAAKARHAEYAENIVDDTARPQIDATAVEQSTGSPSTKLAPAAVVSTAETDAKTSETRSVNPATPSATVATNKLATKLEITEVELTPAQLAAKQLKHAKDLLAEGNNQAALQPLQQALQYDASLHEARRQLAALYYAQGKLDDAAAVLQMGVANYPQNEEFWLLLARVQIARLQWQQADASLAHIADTSSFASEKWLAKIRIAQQQQDWPQVALGYQQLLSQAPEDGRWLFGYAHALDAQGNYVAAIPEYQKALTMSGLSVDARAYIENRLLQIGESR